MSMLALEDFAERLGIEEEVTFQDWVRSGNLLGQLHDLEDDMDVLSLVSMVGKDGIVEIFIIVPVKPLHVDYSAIAINLDDSSEEEEKVEEGDEEVQEEEEEVEHEEEEVGEAQDEFDMFEEYYGFSMPESAEQPHEEPAPEQPANNDKPSNLHDVPVQSEEQPRDENAVE